MKYFLTKNEFNDMINELIKMLVQLKEEINKEAFENVRGCMGIMELNDLEKLNSIPKDEILYNKFETFYKEVL